MPETVIFPDDDVSTSIGTLYSSSFGMMASVKVEPQAPIITGTLSSVSPACFQVVASSICGPEKLKSPESVCLPSIIALNSAIAEALRALRTRYPSARLWAIFEPRSNTVRRKILQKELVSSLSLADQVVIASVFKAEAIPEDERLTTSAVVAGIKRAGKPARELPDADAIVLEVTPELLPGDVVAILSNGGFGGIYEKLPRKLEELRTVRAALAELADRCHGDERPDCPILDGLAGTNGERSAERANTFPSA